MQVNDVTRRFRARPTINLVVTNNIGRLCWPPAQLSGHLDFFQNTCRYCKYRSAGLQEISIPMKPHLERFSKSPTAKSVRGGSKSPACKMFSSTEAYLLRNFWVSSCLLDWSSWEMLGVERGIELWSPQPFTIYFPEQPTFKKEKDAQRCGILAHGHTGCEW